MPFGAVHVPRVKAEDRATLRIDESVQLSGVSAFGEFAMAAMLNEAFELNVYGKTKLKQGALPKADITYNKTVGLKGGFILHRGRVPVGWAVGIVLTAIMHAGLNKLAGFNITEFKILAEDAPDGTNARETVYIPNPTVMAINLVCTLQQHVIHDSTRLSTDDNNNNNQGNVTMDLAVNDTHIGQSFINDLTLHPGDNTVSMTSKVDKMAVVRNLPVDGMLPVVIRGNSSVYQGRELEYFSEALRANTLHARLDVARALV